MKERLKDRKRENKREKVIERENKRERVKERERRNTLKKATQWHKQYICEDPRVLVYHII